MWKDRGKYWENLEEQGTEAWKEERIGLVTASQLGYLTEKSNLKTPEQIGKIIAGEEEVFPESNLEDLARGHHYEGETRYWAAQKFGCKIIERGLCVSKKDPLFAASVDGDAEKFIFEIKCPRKMYKGIVDYQAAIKNGWTPPKHYYQHILPSHFAQMQQGCFVLEKSHCIYVVRDIYTGEVFTQKIPFLPEYWIPTAELARKNYEKYVVPHLKPGYPLFKKF